RQSTYAIRLYPNSTFFVPLARRRAYRDRLLNSALGPAEASMKIVGIVGSPSAESRSASLLEHVRSRLRPIASSFHVVAVRELPPDALLLGQAADPAIRHAVVAVAAADVVIVATPIYKASYSGVL